MIMEAWSGADFRSLQATGESKLLTGRASAIIAAAVEAKAS
jgi:hypothetical protein